MTSQDARREMVTKYTKWLDESEGCWAKESDIVETAETVQDFVKACREIRDIVEPRLMGCDLAPVTKLVGTQRFKGETRCDLFILDAGDYRLVYKS